MESDLGLKPQLYALTTFVNLGKLLYLFRIQFTLLKKGVIITHIIKLKWEMRWVNTSKNAQDLCLVRRKYSALVTVMKITRVGITDKSLETPEILKWNIY